MAALALARAAAPRRVLLVLIALLITAVVTIVAFAAAHGLPVHHLLGMSFNTPKLKMSYN